MWKTFVTRTEQIALTGWTIIAGSFAWFLLSMEEPIPDGDIIIWVCLAIVPYFIIHAVAWILHSFDAT